MSLNNSELTNKIDLKKWHVFVLVFCFFFFGLSHEIVHSLTASCKQNILQYFLFPSNSG